MRLAVALARPSAKSNEVNVLPEPGGPYMPSFSAACSAFAFLNPLILCMPPLFVALLAFPVKRAPIPRPALDYFLGLAALRTFGLAQRADDVNHLDWLRA